MINVTSGIISTIAGNGFQGVGSDGSSALQTRILYAMNVATNEMGNVIYADYNAHSVWQVRNGIVHLLAGPNTARSVYVDGPAASALFNGPRGVVYLNGTLFVADSNNNRIRRIINV